MQSMDFVRCPAAKAVTLRIIAAPDFLALATHRALGVQSIIAAVEFMQFELKRPVVFRASDHAFLPEFLEDMMSFFC